MTFIRIDSRAAVPKALRGGIVALGNFDGFHLGHQAVVRAAIDWAREDGRPAIVATFDPHPVRHFAPHVPPFRLTSLDQRADLFAAAGADAMYVFQFDDALANVSATDFVADWIGGALGATGVVTGEDFTFGHKRGGDVSVLRDEGAAHGIAARAVPPVFEANLPVSSSRIRDALKAGDCATATRLLTRAFAIAGAVIHGDKIGRTIGYPTANIDMGRYLRPRYGIYAVRARLDDGTVIDGAANLGIRPSFDPPRELLEAYLFDFDGDLYGRTVAVELIAFLRPEAKFDDLDALIAQMDTDCEKARAILAE